MKTNKTRSKEITKQYLSNNARQNKSRIINLMVFTIMFFIALLLISQIV